MTRGYYDRHPRDAAVTKLVAKPVLSIFFPELTNAEPYQSKFWIGALTALTRVVEAEGDRKNVLVVACGSV
jgi:hypothetical protein